MPWRGPSYPGEFPSLGWSIAAWIQANAAIPDRDQAGDPLVLTDEQLRFLAYHYALDPNTGRWRYERGSQLIRPRKWGKAPIAAAMICAEAAGPVLFDGWDAAGEPVGRPWPTPWIQCVANSEEQVQNVWRVLIPMIQLGRLDVDIPDTGITRINLAPNYPGGAPGRVEPVTAAARSRFGARTTFAVMDETHLWQATNGGHRLAETLTMNLAGTQGRFVETTNAFDPAENSVAQRTFDSNDPQVFIDDAPAPHGSVRNVRERDKVLEAVYGDSLRGPNNPNGWIDKQRIHVEIDALLGLNDGAAAERMFLNRKLASEGAAFNHDTFRTLAQPHTVPAQETICLGVDGARHDDAIAVIATHLKTGYQWPVIILERPQHAPENYEHDFKAVDGAVTEAFERYLVWRCYIDDQYIGQLVEQWQNRYGERRVLVWHTNRPRPIAWAVRRYEEAIGSGDLSHDGNPRFVEHIRNARRRNLTVLDDKERIMHTLSKDTIGSPRKIDAAMAAVLSWEARSDAISAGAVYLGADPEPEPTPEPDHYHADHAPAVSDLIGAVAMGQSIGGPMPV